jgi:hypothetical protein
VHFPTPAIQYRTNIIHKNNINPTSLQGIPTELLLLIFDCLDNHDQANLRLVARSFHDQLSSLFLRTRFNNVNIHFKRERFIWVAKNCATYVKVLTVYTESLLEYTTTSDAHARGLEPTQSGLRDMGDEEEWHYWNRDAIEALETAIAQNAITGPLQSLTKLEELYITSSQFKFGCTPDVLRRLERHCSRLSNHIVSAMGNWCSGLKVIHVLGDDQWSGAAMATEPQAPVEIAFMNFSSLTNLQIATRIDSNRGKLPYP